MKYLILLFICIFAWITPAKALDIHLPEYACTMENMTLIAEDIGHFILQGHLNTPSSGYTYTVQDTVRRAQEIETTILLHAASGVALTVITPMKIWHKFTADHTTKAFIFNIKKGFNWGPTQIICERQEG